MRTVLIFLMVLAAPAAASDCEPTTSQPEVAMYNGYYIDDDKCQPDCMYSIWVYEESNGIDGLQRGDEVKDDTCGGRIESDTILF